MSKANEMNFLQRTGLIFNPNENRVITKFFLPGGPPRAPGIFARISNLQGKEAQRTLENVIKRFGKRHRDLERNLMDNFEEVEQFLPKRKNFSLKEKLLIGSFFTMEYSIESAALFNPSITISPNQNDVPEGSVRVILSFRAVGEGHLSSIVFRQGILGQDGSVSMVGGSTQVEQGSILTSGIYDKYDFSMVLKDMGILQPSLVIMDELLDHFTYDELKKAIDTSKSKFKRSLDRNDILANILWLVNTNYEVKFSSKTRLSERVIFPYSENEKKGLEDARFVQFNDSNEKTYYATYTAYSGSSIIPQLIETSDFLNFRVSTLHGDISRNKGAALFPEKVRGKYALISRHDSENLYISFSDNIRIWKKAKLIRKPVFVWETIQIGNCGSPLKTERGWLLLTHGVGPMREYCIGVIMLDLKAPENVIGWLETPLMLPEEQERNGYVPNVVYSCGSVIWSDYLFIPYAMSDTRSSIAKIKLSDLFQIVHWKPNSS